MVTDHPHCPKHPGSLSGQGPAGESSVTPWFSGSLNQTLAEPHFLQLLCAAFSSSAHLAECSDHVRFVAPGQCIQPIGGHGWWHLGHHDHKHSANGDVLTKTLDLKVAHKSCSTLGPSDTKNWQQID